MCSDTSSNLHWSPHIERICKSARKKLGIIYRNFSHTSSSPHVILQLYLSLVHPSLEYASQVWDPHSSKFALRIATKQYYARYEILLDTFQLPSLENRRSFLSLYTFFSIVNDFVYFPPLERIFGVFAPFDHITSCQIIGHMVLHHTTSTVLRHHS